MSRQRMAARRALEVLQDLPSDCSGDDGSDSETEAMVNAAVASIPAGESESSDSSDDETYLLQAKLHFLWHKEEQA